MTDLKTKWGLNFISGAYSVAIALLFILLLRTITVQITPPPQPLTEPYPDTSTEELCEEAGGTWTEGGTARNARPIEPVREEPTAYCQGPLAFEREREAQAEKSRQTAMFVYAIGGAIAVTTSVLMTNVRVLPAGFILGGIFAFFWAGTQLWQLVPGIGRLITMAVLFAFLVGVGWYVFADDKKKK